MKIDVEKDELANLTYSQAGLSSTNCNLEAGGYCVIGKLVIVNLRLRAKTDIAHGSTILSGLPLEYNGDSHVPLIASLYYAGGYVYEGNVTIQTSQTVNNGIVIRIGAVYLAK